MCAGMRSPWPRQAVQCTKRRVNGEGAGDMSRWRSGSWLRRWSWDLRCRVSSAIFLSLTWERCRKRCFCRAQSFEYRDRRQRDNSRVALSAVERLKARPLPRLRDHAAHSHTEGDVVLLRDRKNASHEGTLVKLQSSTSTHTHRGIIPHSGIIGKKPRQLVQSSKGASYRIHEPTLAEYVRLTPRLVTPVRLMLSIYAADCVKEGRIDSS